MKLHCCPCLLVAFLFHVERQTHAFVPLNTILYRTHSRKISGLRGLRLQCESSDSSDDTEKNETWDVNVDYNSEWPKNQAPPDPSTAWDAVSTMPEAPRLGINLSLEPLNEEQAQKLKREAEKIINSRIDEGIEDIEKLRKKMIKEMDQSTKIMKIASELDAKEKSEELMKKIDKLTADFLATTKETRLSTKTAAAASRGMEGTNQGLEMGTWGTLSGRAVVASENRSLLGSVDYAMQQQTRSSSTSVRAVAPPIEHRILLVADTKQDPLARQLVPALTRWFEKANIPNCQLEVLTPTATMPLGGKNAVCVIVFCTSLSQASSLSGILDKLLRKTLQVGGAIGQPPTQLVGISTLGTERTDKFPYSVANFLGKLDQRRQIEEVLINTIHDRKAEPPMDYTLIKLGEMKSSTKTPFTLQPGDALDDPTTVDTVAQTIVQAVAYQPFARNGTLSIAGALPASADEINDSFWEAAFLCLEGPELLRIENVGDISLYGKLLEYVQGWADILAESETGLTTPVRSSHGIETRSSHLMELQDGVQLLFLPTNTGNYYRSKKEERQREQAGRKDGTVRATSIPSRKNVREGGVDVIVEITKDRKLRVRARRCNYASDAVVKVLSEETILKRLKDAMDVWRKGLP